MTAAYFDPNPRLLEIAADSNPLNRLGRPDELRGVVTWLASDASTFCTGSEYVISALWHPPFELTSLSQHLGEWWPSRVVIMFFL